MPRRGQNSRAADKNYVSIRLTFPGMRMEITKKQALHMLHRVGPREMLAEAERTLPDPIDLDRDAALLARFGLERGQLEERLGEGP